MNENARYSSLKSQKSKVDNCEKCMKSWVKTLLLFFNIILLACSIGIIIYCSLYFYKREVYITNLIGTHLFIAYYLLIISGISLIIIAIIAFIGIGKNIIKLIYAYVILLVFVFILEAIAVALTIYYGSYFLDAFKLDLKRTMTDNYNDNNIHIVEATDILQIKYKCCGSGYYSDWADSVFVRHQRNKTDSNVAVRQVPESCCKTRTHGCGEITHPSNIFHQGCVYKFYEAVSKNLFIIEYIALGCLGAQVWLFY